MKLAGKIAACGLTLCALALFAFAEPTSQLKPTGYVNDFAQVLDANTVAQLDNVCRQLDQNAQAQISIVTIKTLDGADIVSYSVDLYQKWGIGKKGTDRGVLILLAVQDHRYQTTVGYGLEGILPDGKVGSFGREAVPLLQQNDFNGAVSLLTARVAGVISQDAGITLTGPQPQAPAQTPEQGPPQGLSTGGIIFLIVIVLIVLLTPLRKVLFWFLLFGGGGGGGYGGGGWGGGGFGGGGGGFGGFGGGSTGGGGAGGSW